MTPHARKDSRRTLSPRPTPLCRPEALEQRVLMAADKAPTVEAVFVNGTDWSPAFRAYLEAGRDGSSQFGYELGAGGGGSNAILPWVNLNQVSVQFSEDVVVQQDDLEIDSLAGADYTVTAFAYDPSTFTATWTLSEPLDADVLTLRLDATGADAITDQTGNPLRGNGGGPSAGDVEVELAVLPGDTDRSGEVLQNDYLDVSARFFSSVNDERAATGSQFRKYTIFHDVDGSGIILAEDNAAVRQRVGTSLPQ